MTAPDQKTLATLLTEARNPAPEHLDELSTLEMLGIMNDEDEKVASAVRAELPNMARSIERLQAQQNIRNSLLLGNFKTGRFVVAKIGPLLTGVAYRVRGQSTYRGDRYHV